MEIVKRTRTRRQFVSAGVVSSARSVNSAALATMMIISVLDVDSVPSTVSTSPFVIAPRVSWAMCASTLVLEKLQHIQLAVDMGRAS